MINAVGKNYLSDYNKDALLDYAGSLWKEAKLHEEKSNSVWNTIVSYLPSSRSVGSLLGEWTALTYGAQLSNSTVDFLASKIFNQPAPSLSYWEIFKNKVTGAAQTTVTGSVKVLVTPGFVKSLSLLGATAGGMTGAALAGTIVYMYHQYLNNAKGLAKLQALSLDQLIKVSESGQLIDAFGRELSANDIKMMQRLISKYNLITLLSRQERDKVSGFLFDNYLIEKEGAWFYANGKQVGEQDKQAILLFIEELNTSLPPGINKTNLSHVIHLLTLNLPTFDSLDNQSADHYMMQCEDGEYCLKRPLPGDHALKGKERGSVLKAEAEEGINEIREAYAYFEEKELEKIRKEKEMIDGFISIDLENIEDTMGKFTLLKLSDFGQ